MSKEQLAFLAADLIPQLAKAAEGRQRGGKRADENEKGTSHELAARELNVPQNAVRNAKEVRASCPELRQFVLDKKIGLSAAAAIAREKDHGKRGAAIQAVQNGEDAKRIRRILRGETAVMDEVQFSEADIALLDDWDRQRRNLLEFSTWVAELEASNKKNANCIGRVLLENINRKTLAKITTAMEDGKPYARCVSCPKASFCTQCCGSGWVTQREDQRIRHAPEEESKSKKKTTRKK
ncbi:MAG: hypothetical protein KDB23_02435 [Planctomycetales bacterium]|nr:hypothetical protein [Planctomycetales bacterium]